MASVSTVFILSSEALRVTGAFKKSTKVTKLHFLPSTLQQLNVLSRQSIGSLVRHMKRSAEELVAQPVLVVTGQEW